MRSQANSWAMGLRLRNMRLSVAQGTAHLEGSISVSEKASRRRTDGVVDHGTAEEDGPETREILVFLSENGIRGTPVNNPQASSGRARMAMREEESASRE